VHVARGAVFILFI